jgi:hypothetical protein
MWLPLGLFGVVLVFAMIKAANASKSPSVVVTHGPGRIVRPRVEPKKDPVEDKQETEKFVQEEIKNIAIKKLPVVIPTPSFLEGLEVKDEQGETVKFIVMDEYWTLYVKSVQTGGQTTITPTYNLGLFGLGMRILEDFGYAKNVKKVNYNGKLVWKGEFAGPYSLEKFLADATLQYEVFLKMTHSHFNYITKKHRGIMYFNQILINGKQITYSGLLAVAKFAGLSGMDKWITGDRKEATTRAFEKSNSIF